MWHSSIPNQETLSGSDLPQSDLLLHSKEKRRLLIPKHHVDIKSLSLWRNFLDLGSQTAGTTANQ